MRHRIGASVALAALIVLAAPTHAAQPRKSQVPYKMEDVNHAYGAPGGGGATWSEDDAYVFKLRKGERFISVNIVDDSEEPIAGVIQQFIWDYNNGGAKVGHSGTYIPFCGRTDKPVKVLPGIQVEIFLRKGTCEDGTPSLPTNGKILAEISKRR
jgi:hypothetical protein